jgi:hypothetical protein
MTDNDIQLTVWSGFRQQYRYASFAGSRFYYHEPSTLFFQCHCNRFRCMPTHSYFPISLTHSLSNSLTNSLNHSLYHSLTHSLCTVSLTDSFTVSLNDSFTVSLTDSFTDSFTHSRCNFRLAGRYPTWLWGTKTRSVSVFLVPARQYWRL